MLPLVLNSGSPPIQNGSLPGWAGIYFPASMRCVNRVRRFFRLNNRQEGEARMATLIRSDLEFILEQIAPAEADAAGTSSRTLVANPTLPLELRTVDRSCSWGSRCSRQPTFSRQISVGWGKRSAPQQSAKIDRRARQDDLTPATHQRDRLACRRARHCSRRFRHSQFFTFLNELPEAQLSVRSSAFHGFHTGQKRVPN